MSSVRERLTRSAAEDAYVRTGEVQVFRQLQHDADAVDRTPPEEGVLAIGPFSRLKTDAVADELGKTRGAINHLWGNQDRFRAAVMHNFLNDTTLGVDEVESPDPAGFVSVDAWIEALATAEIERGPRHGMQPESCYGLRWAAWLGLAPYGVWSERIARPSIVEFRNQARRYAVEVLQPALEHFGLQLDVSTSIDDLAVACVSQIEGTWLNACVSVDDPIGRDTTIASSLSTSLRMLVRGATTPSSTTGPTASPTASPTAGPAVSPTAGPTASPTAEP